MNTAHTITRTNGATTKPRTRKPKWRYNDPPEVKLEDRIINVSGVTRLDWLPHTIYVTESVWERIELTPEQRRDITNRNLHTIARALWAELYGFAPGRPIMEVTLPLINPDSKMWECVELNVKVDYVSIESPSLILMFPDE